MASRNLAGTFLRIRDVQCTENNENMALGMGKAFLHYGKYDSLEEAFTRIEAVSATELCDVANEIFDESALSSLIYE